MSRATVISLVPFPIAEFKPGIYPGFFEIEPSTDNVPQLLVVEDSKYHVEIDENRTITVKCPAEDIARSIVEDYVSANLAFDIEEDASPAIFWKPGKFDLEGVKSNFSKDIEYQLGRQIRWFNKLVRMADDDWEKTRQHKAISDIQRYAAKALKLARPWVIVSAVQEGIIKCIACQQTVDAKAIVCPFCKCILNMDKYKTLQFAEK